MGVRMRGAIRGPAVTASLLLLLLTGVASPVGAQAAAGDPQPPGERTVLEGTAIYRERMRLPPGAVFEAQIEDTSRAEAPADVVARTTVPSPGGPPIPFAVAYDPARIDPSGTYVVRARIVVGNAVLFTTDAVTRVLTGGHPASASLLLRRVLGGAPTMAGPPAVTTSTQSPPSFEQTRWAAARLGATDVTATGSRAPHLVFEGGRASGSDGCNRVSGGLHRRRAGAHVRTDGRDADGLPGDGRGRARIRRRRTRHASVAHRGRDPRTARREGRRRGAVRGVPREWGDPPVMPAQRAASASATQAGGSGSPFGFRPFVRDQRWSHENPPRPA